MARPKIVLDKKLLQELYVNQNLTPAKIGEQFGCSFKTVRNRLSELKIPFKTPAFARMRYKKFDCTVTISTRAYMMGFRIGDLSVYRRSVDSETVVVRCHTTQQEQVDVIRSLFKDFGKVTVSVRHGPHFNVNCFLNRSFDFLFLKDEPSWKWVRNEDVLGAPFIAGYTDAEGNFIINQGRGRFKIDAYDKEVLEWMSSWLVAKGIYCKYRCVCKKEASWNKKFPFKKDLWRLNINDAVSLEKFILLILPHLRHKIRLYDAKACLRNIHTRRKNGTIK